MPRGAPARPAAPPPRGAELSGEGLAALRSENKRLRRTCHLPLRALDAGVYGALGAQCSVVDGALRSALRRDVALDLEKMRSEEAVRFSGLLDEGRARLLDAHTHARMAALRAAEEMALHRDEYDADTAKYRDLYEKERARVVDLRRELVMLNSNVRAFALVRSSPVEKKNTKKAPPSRFCFEEGRVTMSSDAELRGRSFALDGLAPLGAPVAPLSSLVADYTDMLAQGHSLTVLHFGPTHSGKYSAFRLQPLDVGAVLPGAEEAAAAAPPPAPVQGTFDLCMRWVFHHCQRGFRFEATVVEVFSDQLYDVQTMKAGRSNAPSPVGRDVKGALPDCRWTPVESAAECANLMSLCEHRRRKAWGSEFESHQRLAHLLFTLRISSESWIRQHYFTVGVLAGSEDHFLLGETDAASTSVDASVMVLKEALHSMAFAGPSSSSTRKSRLTRALKPNLKDGGKVLLVLHLTTDEASARETERSLEFATKCMDRELTTLLNEATGGRFSLTDRRTTGLEVARRISVASAVVQKAAVRKRRATSILR